MVRSRGGGPPSQRQLRVGEEVRHALVRVLGRGEIRDPDLAEAQITVTEVRMSPDLRHATAFITPLGGGDAGPLVKACKRAAPFFRSQLARELTLKFVPDVSFAADTSFDQTQRLDDLLRTLPDAPPAGTDPKDS